MNHYPRHIGDITRDTFGLSLAEFGAYDRLLDAYYANERPLPLDAGERYRMAGATTRVDRAAVDYVVGRYFREGADGWHQKRADAEIAAYQSRADSARRNGASGGRPRNRTETDSVISGKPTDNQTITGSKANQEPEPEPLKPPEGGEQSEPRRAPARKARGSRLDPAWELPEDWCQWAVTERAWTPQEAQRVAAEFRDYWLGKGETRADWQATWRNWVRRERTRSSNGNARHEPRQRVAAAIFPTGDDNAGPTERVIDGEARRIA